MKYLFLLLSAIPLIAAPAEGKKDSEFSQRYRLLATDRFRMIATNGSGGYSNFTVSAANILDSIGGLYTNNAAGTSNSVTASVTNLLTVTITTNILDSDGDTISFDSGGTFASSAQAKSLFVTFGGTTLGQVSNILNTVASSNGFYINGVINRKTSASYIATVNFIPSSGNISIGAATNYTFSSTVRGVESFATNNTLAIRTLAISAADVTNEFLRVFNLPVLQLQ